MEELQKLFEDLRRVHPPPRRRHSGLTVVDSVSQPPDTWWVHRKEGPKLPEDRSAATYEGLLKLYKGQEREVGNIP